MKPILKYPGAKWRLADWVISFMPPHESYVEPYAGSLAVFLNKAPARINTLNDLDGDVVNFFITCREHPDELAVALSLTPWARSEFEAAELTDEITDSVEIIKAIKKSGNHVQILTKGGSRALRDFDLLDGGDWFGVTITGADISVDEPNAAGFDERLNSIKTAKSHEVNTWVSFEPVLEPLIVYSAIEFSEYIDRFKIGKLNYHPSNINWADFGRECERLCIEYGRDYYIKDSLRREMEKVPWTAQ